MRYASAIPDPPFCHHQCAHARGFFFPPTFTLLSISLSQYISLLIVYAVSLHEGFGEVLREDRQPYTVNNNNVFIEDQPAGCPSFIQFSPLPGLQLRNFRTLYTDASPH